ncbi:probable DNA double-strand break repair Rad50 ATPase [Tripterygium wilfordii]|uniref:probable DNA double-strand break repair Rad50 ATPase n=1 Tax=Tripterygium wilfordii TaxID=458696 RepID=UPI0018F811B0|nr:probable DNA double-strand break repair Rad50 ATPase [Tripterygium wilfordii]
MKRDEGVLFASAGAPAQDVVVGEIDISTSGPELEITEADVDEWIVRAMEEEEEKREKESRTKKGLDRGEGIVEDQEKEARKKRKRGSEGYVGASKRARIFRRIECSFPALASAHDHPPMLPTDTRRLLFPRDRQIFERKGLTRVVRESVHDSFKLLQSSLFVEDEIVRLRAELNKSKEEAEELRTSVDEANSRAETAEATLASTATSVALEMEKLRAEVERVRADEQSARVNEARVVEELKIADEQILAFKKYKSEMDVVLEEYQAAKDLADEMRKKLMNQLSISERERTEALANAQRAESDLAALTRKMTKKTKKWHKRKAKFDSKLKEAEAARLAIEADHHEKVKIIGGVAGALARLEMLKDYRDGREATWDLAEEIADCEIVLKKFGHLYEPVGSGEGEGDEGADDLGDDDGDEGNVGGHRSDERVGGQGKSGAEDRDDSK